MARKTWLMSPWPESPWRAFDELRRGMDELFERVETRGTNGGVFPPVNIYETPDGYVLTAELPGVSGKDVQVSIERNRVTLGGERKIEYPHDAEMSAHRLERPSGSFRRTIELPVDLDAEKAQAVHRHGILMLRIPKAPEHRPRQIAVRGS